MRDRGKSICIGLAGGFVNGLFGAGGGLVLVPMLRKWASLETKRAHATSVAVIAAISVVSAAIYLWGGRVGWGDAVWYMLGGAAGGALGAFVLRSIPATLLRRVFGAFLIYSAVRMLCFG